MKSVGLIQCVKGKGLRPCRAKDLYTSTFFRLGRRYLERHCCEWGILSAKYGLNLPDDVIAPYELVVHASAIIRSGGHYVELSDKERAAWRSRVRSQVEDRWPGRSFLALMGADYLKALEGLPVSCPIAGLRVFERNAWLSRSLKGL